MSMLRSIPNSDERPVIQLTTELADTADRAIEAIAYDDVVYQRDGRLVHVVRVTETETDERMALSGMPQIRLMTAATLRERLTRLARFERFEKRAKKWVPALPSEPLVQAVLARGEYRYVRPLVGIIEAPSIRPDGTIIQDEGYDRATGYLYAPSCEFPPVPSTPTQGDARRALEELEEPFADFPFAGPPHRASTMAALLTIVARPAIRGSVPAFLHDANVRGSGKTLKADCVSAIATGRPTAKMQYPKDDDELEKVLGAYGLRGSPVINFDNVTRTFGGGPLDRCLTAGDLVELRVLGKSEIPTVRWVAIIMATGNNMAIAGDTSRRVLISRLESPLENPEERQTWKHHPLLTWVQENRPRLVIAALTILRAWHVAGRPNGECRAWGSFEAWSALIPPAIVFAGGADPMTTRPSASGEEDAEKHALVAILEGLGRLDSSGRGLTAKTIVESLYPRDRWQTPREPDGYDDMREAIESLTGAQAGKPPSVQRLGKKLQKFKRRVVGGRTLDCRYDDHTKVAYWVVVAGIAGNAGHNLRPRARTVSDNSGDTSENNHRNARNTRVEEGP